MSFDSDDQDDGFYPESGSGERSSASVEVTSLLEGNYGVTPI